MADENVSAWKIVPFVRHPWRSHRSLYKNLTRRKIWNSGQKGFYVCRIFFQTQENSLECLNLDKNTKELIEIFALSFGPGLSEQLLRFFHHHGHPSIVNTDFSLTLFLLI